MCNCSSLEELKFTTYILILVVRHVVVYRSLVTCWSVIPIFPSGALQKALCDDTPGPSPADSGFRELQQRIISYVRGLPGNNLCCDCGGTNGIVDLLNSSVWDGDFSSNKYSVTVCNSNPSQYPNFYLRNFNLLEQIVKLWMT